MHFGIMQLNLSLPCGLHNVSHYWNPSMCLCTATVQIDLHVWAPDSGRTDRSPDPSQPPRVLSVDRVSYRSALALLHYRPCLCCCSVSAGSALLHLKSGRVLRHWLCMMSAEFTGFSLLGLLFMRLWKARCFWCIKVLLPHLSFC